MHESGRRRNDLVLVIDDESTVLQALELLLGMWGYRVVTAADEDEAVARLAALGEAPRAILADYRLREGRTGLQAIARVRALAGACLPGIIITGDGASAGLREARAAGMPVLQKPVPPLHLQAMLGHALRGRAAPDRPAAAAAASG